MPIDKTSQKKWIQDLLDWHPTWHKHEGIDGQPFSWTGTSGQGKVIYYIVSASFDDGLNGIEFAATHIYAFHQRREPHPDRLCQHQRHGQYRGQHSDRQ